MQNCISNEKVAELTIRSFTLLGLSLDVYPALINTQILENSFDKTNEKLLLCLLHFLLNKLDNSFAVSVISCWPFYETKEKNEFKRIVTSYIGKVSSSSNPTLSNADFRTSLLTVAKGPAVWMLLRRLCDTALEQSIRSLILTNQTQSTVAMTLRQSNGLWSTLTSTNTEELTTAINHEYNNIVREGNICTARQDEQMAFSSELDIRLKTATKRMKDAKSNMVKISNSEKVNYLTENAQIERSELILRIQEMYAALKQLSTSSTFIDCDTVAAYYSDPPMESNETGTAASLSTKLQKLQIITDTDDQAEKINIEGQNEGKDGIENEISNQRENTDSKENDIPEPKRTTYSSVWHLDAPSLDPLSEFLEAYTLAKRTRIKDDDGVPGLALGRKQERASLPAIVDRAEKLVMTMRVLESKARGLTLEAVEQIELI